jgi:serine/threonine protein kinase/Flp pilus assembly protein TadD
MNTLAPAPEQAGSADQALGVLIDELTSRLQAGQVVDVPAFLGAHPEHAQRLQQLLPALQMLADVGRSPAAGCAEGLVPPDPNDAAVGTLGDFRLLREVGRGGMGVVYEAVQISLGRRVALKVLPFAAALDARQLQRFKNEAQAAANLHHTNVVPVYGVGTERGVHYYAMQFIEGHTLAAMIHELRQTAGLDGPPTERLAGPAPPHDLVTGPWAPGQCGRAEPQPTGPYTPSPASASVTHPATPLTSGQAARGRAFFRTAANLGVQAAEALEHAHQLGVVHRDIKPANLLVETSSPPSPLGTAAGGEGLRLWITDFGLAHCQNQAGLTMTGDLVGTLRYMSPEQVLAKRVPVDHRTDVYSLGVTLYELLTLRPAFGGNNRPELLRQIAFEEPRPPRQRDKAIPAELETVVLKAMEKNPAERYATAQELADDLRRYLADRPIRAKRPTLWQRLAKWSRRHRPLVAAGLVMLLTVLGASLLSSVLIFRAYQAEATEHAQAKESLRFAVEVFDKIYLQLAQDQSPRDPRHEREVRKLLNRALPFYEQFVEHYRAHPTVRMQVVRAYRRMGDIHRLVGRLAEAKQAYAAAITTAGQLTEGAGSDQVALQALAASYNSLAEVEMETGDLAAADGHLGRAVELLSVWVNASPSFPAYRAELARSYHYRGLVLKQRGQRPPAEEHYGQAILLLDELARQFPGEPEYRAELAQVHSSAARWTRGPDNRENWPGNPQDDTTAGAHLRSAVKLLSGLANNFPDVPLYRQRLAAALEGVANLIDSKPEIFQQAIAIYSGLAAEFPTVPEYRAGLATACINLGFYYWIHTDVDPATECFRKAVELSRKLAAESPQATRHRELLAVSLLNHGEAMFVRGGLDGAGKLLDEAIGHFRALAKEFPQHFIYPYGLIFSCELSAAVFAALGKNEEAKDRQQQAEQAWGDTVAAFQNTARRQSALSHYCLHIADGWRNQAWVLGKLGRTQQAIAAEGRAIRWYDKGIDLSPQNGRLFISRGAAYLGLGKRDQAIADYRRAIVVTEVLAAKFPNEAGYRAIQGEAGVYLGNVLMAAGRVAEADKAYRRAQVVWEELVADYPQTPIFQGQLAAVREILRQRLQSKSGR